MLKPAILFKKEIENNFKNYFYTDDMMYETGYLDNWTPDISENPDDCTYQYAIVDSNNNLKGYLAYAIDWYGSSAYNFGLISFDRGNPIIGKDLFNELEKLIHEYKLHRIEWRLVSGNPAKRSYDRFCKKYNGNIIKLTDVFKDRRGEYHDSYIYEILN